MEAFSLTFSSRNSAEWFKLLAFELYTTTSEMLILEEFEFKSQIILIIFDYISRFLKN